MRNKSKKEKDITKRGKGPFAIICLQVNGSNWKGNVPTDSQSVTDTTGTVTKNADLVAVTSQSLSTAHGASSTITLNNTRIVSGVVVRASIVAYSGVFGTNGIPVASIKSIDTSGHSCVIAISNAADTNALSGTVQVLVEVVTLPV